MWHDSSTIDDKTIRMDRSPTRWICDMWIIGYKWLQSAQHSSWMRMEELMSSSRRKEVVADDN